MCCNAGPATAYHLYLSDGTDELDLGIQTQKLPRILKLRGAGYHKQGRFGAWTAITQINGERKDEAVLSVTGAGVEVRWL